MEESKSSHQVTRSTLPLILTTTTIHTIDESMTNDQAAEPPRANRYEDDTGTAILDLRNDIHPIFAASKFELSEIVCDSGQYEDSILPYTREIEYEAMVPMLRLASLLLSTDCLLDYWYAVLCNDVRDLDDESEDGDESTYEDGSEIEDESKGDEEAQVEEEPKDERSPDKKEISRDEEELQGGEEVHIGTEEEASNDSDHIAHDADIDAVDTEKSPSESEDDDDESVRHPENYAVIRKGRALNEAEIAEAKSALEVLTQYLCFARAEMVYSPTCVAVTQGYSPLVTTSDSRMGKTFLGPRSHILFNTAHYSKLVDLYNEAKQCPEGEMPKKFLFLSFHVAVSFVHELAHVSHLARFGATEITFENNTCIENGFDWEDVVFGGVELEATNLVQWHDRGQDTPTPWPIPEDFIMQLFRNEFWEVEVARKGAEALKVPKNNELSVTRA